MAKVRVIKAFRLNAPDGRQLEFQEGVQQIDDDLVSHWFVQAHIEAEEVQEAKTEARRPGRPPKDASE
ncbi:STY1053 family phage-associated protein [Achromobacter xylosoxidans]|uniref:STY1053 family phage-associated protein n=1 Tax=Alcaligenes xylosoxydans xylosoxydans TaxID=85698 RepID=UPI0038FC8D1F